MANKLLFKTSTSNDSSYLTKSNSTVAKSPGTIYFTKDGKIVYDLNSNTRLIMSDNVSYATTAGTAEKAIRDKNGKDITTYMAYAEWDTKDNTTLHLQNSSGTNIFSAKLADKFLPLVAGSAHPLTGDLYISAGDEDRFLQFSYTGTGYDWRIGYLGSGLGNENYLVFQSDGTDGVKWTNALRFGLTDLNATFGGSILPSSTGIKDIGSSSLRWKDVYATTFIGNLDGNANTATKATSDSSGRNIEQTYLKNISLENEYKLYKTTGNGTKTLIGDIAPLDSDHLIPLKYLPPAALERIYLVDKEADRLALTASKVQNGDIVRVNETKKMYIVYDDTKLGTEDAFRVFIAGSATSADTARYAESAGKATNDSDGNKISASYIKYPFTLNANKTQIIIANGVGAKTTLDYNYYPTAMTWTKGTSAGPTATIDMAGIADITVNAIPKATKTESGIVIVGDQTFGGAKTFDDNVTIQKTLTVSKQVKIGNGADISTDPCDLEVVGGVDVGKNLRITGGTANTATIEFKQEAKVVYDATKNAFNFVFN